MEQIISADVGRHKQYLKLCADLAQIAKSHGESPVGSLIVRQDNVIAEGIEASRAGLDITLHAEIQALRAAMQYLKSQDLSECILYSTHEPCIMCSYMIRHAKIETVVFAVTVGVYGGFSSKYPLLLDSSIHQWGTPPKIITGILDEELNCDSHEK